MSEKRKSYLDWDEYFMSVAILSSLRSKDPSTQVGACIVKDKKIMGTGYNGAPNGMNDDVFPRYRAGEETNNVYAIKNTWVVHAELNAILNSNNNLKGSTLYVTLFPCNECAKAIAQSGIKKVVYLRTYDNIKLMTVSKAIFDAADVEYVPYNEDKDFIKDEVKAGSESIQKILKLYSRNYSRNEMLYMGYFIDTFIEQTEKEIENPKTKRLEN